jgi:hypothetical protein
MMRTMPGIEFNQITKQITWTFRNGIWSYWMILWHNPAKINVFLIFLRKEVIIEICPSSILFKIYFIRAKKWEISV